MLRRIIIKRAQSIAEYSLFLTLVAAALLTMQVYMKRGFQGVLKFAADEVGFQEEESTAEKIIISSNSNIATELDNSYKAYTNLDGASGRKDINNTTMSYTTGEEDDNKTVELERDEENEEGEEPYGLVY